MKKTIFGFFIAISAFLSATYVSANKLPSNYYIYVRTFDGSYRMLHTNYSYSNCAVLTPWDNLMKCGFRLKHDSIWTPPEYLRWDEVFDLLNSGDMEPITDGIGIYLDD